MNHIPVLRENTDPLRQGLAATSVYQPPPHPLESAQLKFHQNEVQFKRVALDNIFGTHMPMRLQMEQAILSEFQRLPTLHSDYVGLETMLGIDEDIGFEDFLTDPTSPEYGVDVHQVMESKLGL